MIIGLTGKKQCGKDTVANYLEKKHLFLKQSFAEPLKQIGKILGFAPDLEGADKEVINERWGMSARTAWQKIGTDLFRDNFDKDVWVKIAENDLDIFTPKYNVVFTDVRFDNEAEMIRRRGGTIMEIRRHTGLKDTHSSEAGLSMNLINYVIHNNGTIEELFPMVDKVMSRLTK